LLLGNEFKFSEMALFTILSCGQSGLLLSHAAFGPEPIPTEKGGLSAWFFVSQHELILKPAYKKRSGEDPGASLFSIRND
jgi:hypothetical protein